MLEVIFDCLGNIVMILIGIFMGSAYSLYRHLSKKVNILEKNTLDCLEEIDRKLLLIKMKMDHLDWHICPSKPQETVPKKRKPGRPPKAIEMKNPQQ